MATHLPQNQFISNSTVIPEPPAVASTADSECRLQNVARPDATAERDPHPISESALASAMTADAAAGPEFADPPVPAAVCFDCGYRDPCDEDCPNYIDEPSMTNGGDQEAPASAPSKNPDVGVLADRIDWHEFFEAVMDERIVLFELYDEVPLFLRDGDHLRRWEA